jgi:hypothetical protein
MYVSIEPIMFRLSDGGSAGADQGSEKANIGGKFQENIPSFSFEKSPNSLGET